MIYLKLFYEFFITGLLTFGGGLASIPFLQQMSGKTGWFTIEELMNIIAVSEATPGPVSVNMATYAGYITAGIPGGIIATIGMITPCAIIAMIVARLLSRFRDNEIVNSAFYGLRPASLGLIAAAGVAVLRLSMMNIGLWQETGAIYDLLNFKALALAAVLFVLAHNIKLHPIVFLAASAVVGILIF